VEKKNTEILITGAGGLLGSCLVNILSRDYTVKGIGRSDCDIRNTEKIKEIFRAASPRVVIHTAALTDVDACEKNPQLAFEVNVEGTRNIAQACAQVDSILVFISTDYVFDGRKDSPYSESDRAGPINVYGRSKFEAEKICQEVVDKSLIVRTSWLFGAGRRDFVDTVIDKIRQGENFGVVSDKYSIPTYNVDLSRVLGDLIKRLLENYSDNLGGIYHLTNSDSCSWYEFALKIKVFYGRGDVEIFPITLDEYDFVAERPRYTVLENKRFFGLFGYRLRPWEEALKEEIERCYRS